MRPGTLFPIMAVFCLTALIPPAVRADLADNLMSCSCEEQKAARAEFDRLDQQGKEAFIPRFREMIHSGSGRSKYTAMEFLEKIGAASIPVAAELLNDADPKMRENGVDILESIKSDEAIPLLEMVVETEQEESVLWSAIDELADRKRVDIKLFPSLIKALGKPEYASFACKALAVLGQEAEPAIPALVECIDKAYHSEGESGDTFRMTRAMELLQSFGPKALPATAVLIELLGDDDYSVRSDAAKTLAKIGLGAEPAIIAAINSANVRQREAATEVLALMEPYSEKSIATFIGLAQDENDTVRENAARALEKVDTDAARDALARMNEKKNERLRMAEAAEKALAERIWTKAEIEASSPPDANHKYERKLDRSFWVTGANTEEFFVTIHAGVDWPWSVAVWAKLGEDNYKRLWMEEYCLGCGIVEEIVSFSFRHIPFLCLVWLNGGSSATRDYFLFALAPGHQLKPVGIEDAENYYESKLKEGEHIMDGQYLSFSEDDVAFSFEIWNKDDPHVSPTAGSVSGTFKLVGDPLSDKEAKFVVDTCER